PDGYNTMLLLSDGTVMMEGGDSGGIAQTWYQLTPDLAGNYTQGTWSEIASMDATRLYYASNVLPDGRVFLVGGEYSSQGSDTNTGEIYDPLTNSWQDIATFPEPSFGDGPSQLLPDGRVLAGYQSGPQTYIYNPQTNTWSFAADKLLGDPSGEEMW